MTTPEEGGHPVKLFASRRSPYVRKVLAVAHELGVDERLDLVGAVVSTFDADAAVVAANPLGQIPTLVTADGVAVYDSPVICEYLTSLVPSQSVLPPVGPARWAALARQAVGDGLCDVLIRWYGERRRADDPLSPRYVEAWRSRLVRVAAALDREAGGWDPGVPDVGQIALACALAYADFRIDHPWRTGNPTLVGWFDAISARPSMIATRFEAT